MQQDFDGQLNKARRRLDARTAALISPDRTRYLLLIRGGEPDREEWEQARQEATLAVGSALDESAASGILSGVLSGIGSEAEDMATILEIDLAGLTVTRVSVDTFGSPHFDRDYGCLAWTDLLPTLAAEDDRRTFQLAGGLAGLDRTGLWNDLERGLPSMGGLNLLVICRLAGWLIAERAAELACAAHPAARLVRVAMSGPVAAGKSMIDSLAERWPLPQGYGVIVAATDPVTRELRTHARPLFARGDTPGTESSLVLRRVPGDHGETAVAVAVGNGTSQDVFCVVSVPQPEEPVYRIRAVLEAPGRIRFTEPPGITPHPLPWPQVLAGVPRRADIALGPIDLVCAIEMAGDEDTVKRRKTLVRELLELLEAEYPESGLLRVALLGCSDHVFAPGREKRRVVRGAPLNSVEAALIALTRLSRSEAHYSKAAPIEDLLHETCQVLAGSHAAGRAARVLLVAGRRPHPTSLGADNILPCPFRWGWQVALRMLTGTLAAPIVTVTDSTPRHAAKTAFWQALGTAALHELPGLSARQLGEDLGILVRQTQRIPVPLNHTE